MPSRNQYLNQENKDNRKGATNDWEALVIVLNELPRLKNRVLHKIRSLREERKERKKG